jgi:hypothetical protein
LPKSLCPSPSQFQIQAQILYVPRKLSWSPFCCHHLKVSFLISFVHSLSLLTFYFLLHPFKNIQCVVGEECMCVCVFHFKLWRRLKENYHFRKLSKF